MEVVDSVLVEMVDAVLLLEVVLRAVLEIQSSLDSYCKQPLQATSQVRRKRTAYQTEFVSLLGQDGYAKTEVVVDVVAASTGRSDVVLVMIVVLVVLIVIGVVDETYKLVVLLVVEAVQSSH